MDQGSKVTMFELSTYVVVVQKSMIIEGENEQYNRDKEIGVSWE